MITTRVLIVAAAAAALLVGGAPAAAQRPAAGGAAQGAPGQRDNRMVLEQRVRERLRQVMRQQLQLTDEQLPQMERALVKFEEQRRTLLRQERELRMTLRAELAAAQGAEGAAEQEAIARSLDRLVGLHRQRLALIEEEQRELATFLTPVQRARYFAMQDNLRRFFDERGGMPGRPGMRPGDGRPGGVRPPPR